MEYSLEGINGNAFCIMAYVRDAMKQTGYTKKECDEYSNKCMQGNYDNLLELSMVQIDECNKRG